MQSGIKLISRIYLKLVLLQVAVGTLLRIVLLFNEQTSDISFTFGQWLKIFLLGAVNDWCALTIGFAVLWLFALSIAPGKYARPLGYILFGILSVAWIYVTFFNTIFDEYGSVVPLIASILFGFWAVSFGLRLFLPQIRPGWSRTWLAVLTGLYTGGIILNAVSEWFFWSEFGVRYNFIAVDYLVYTNEVVGNIMESYPVVPLFAGVLLLTVGCTWLLFRREIRRAGEFGTWQWKAAVSPAYLLLTLGCCLLLQFNTRFQQSANTYANELQATGAYKFYDAFMKNELSYPQFYLTLPQKEAEAKASAIQNFLQKAVDEGKIEADAVPGWKEMAATNFQLVQDTIGSIPAREKISEQIATDPDNANAAADALKSAGQKMAEQVEAVVGKDFAFKKLQ